MAPWIILGQHFTEEEGRTTGLEIDCRHVELCDELWIYGPKECGPKKILNRHMMNIAYDNLSPGMAIEIEHALKHMVPIRDQRQYLEFIK